MLPKVIEMEKIVERSLLYDFYGELLTDHQKMIYEDAVFEDMSLGEIAQEYGISRQGVHDLIRRCDNSLLEYENKLHLIQRFLTVKDRIKEIDLLTENEELSRRELAERIRHISGQILEEL
ncbi:MAG: DNA-binding protein [Lachnospiraceae bacterium]|nr:DNA-binding protein [Lachnospiraceae bacterium]